METITGRIRTVNEFTPDEGGLPERPYPLFSSTPGMPEVLYDLSDFAPGVKIAVQCETHSYHGAWGVSQVDVIYEG